jgi:hypothetical protein
MHSSQMSTAPVALCFGVAEADGLHCYARVGQIQSGLGYAMPCAYFKCNVLQFNQQTLPSSSQLVKCELQLLYSAERGGTVPAQHDSEGHLEPVLGVPGVLRAVDFLPFLSTVLLVACCTACCNTFS